MGGIKIGMLLYPTFGGSGVVATELGKALAEEGNEVHFITYSRPFKLGGFYKNIYYHEVRVSSYPLFEYSPYELVLSSKIVDIVKYYKLDVLHVHYAIPHASAAYMAQRILADQGIDIPYITTLHGTDITLVGKDASFEPVITFAINKSNAVTTVSDSLKRDTLDHFKIKNAIQVIPNFIKLEDYNLGSMDDLKLSYAPEGQKIMSHISNFRKVKRIPDVIKVFAGVRAKYSCKLLMVGDGPLRSKAEDLCKEFGICEDVIFTGKLKSAKEVLAISDIFILPSETESFGLAALEAMASSVPVISSRAGGLPELVEHGVSGYLSKVGDVDDLIENTLKLIGDDVKLAKFKKAALLKAKRYQLKEIVPFYTRLYMDTIEKGA